MVNYIITQKQLEKIISENTITKVPLVDDLRKIHKVLAEKGLEPEEIVDYLIGLRTQDPYIIYKIMKMSDDEDFIDSVNRLSKKETEKSF